MIQFDEHIFQTGCNEPPTSEGLGLVLEPTNPRVCFVFFRKGGEEVPEDLHWTADGRKLIFIDARPSALDPGRNG